MYNPKKFFIMCKLKKALAAGDFESLSTMDLNVNDIESIITDAEAALEDDTNLVGETQPTTSLLRQRIERAQKRINESQAIIENGNQLLEMIEKGEEIFALEDY